MKFSQIKQLTSVGNYRISVPLVYVEETLDHWNRTGKRKGLLDLCPDFQRGHVWTDEKRSKYVEYVLRGGQGCNLIFFNCSSWMTEFNTPIQLVDGLQRITAVRKFLNNELKVFGYLYSEFEDTLRLHYQFLFDVNNLKPRAEVLNWYLELNAGGIAHTPEELDRVRALLAEEEANNPLV